MKKKKRQVKSLQRASSFNYWLLKWEEATELDEVLSLLYILANPSSRNQFWGKSSLLFENCRFSVFGIKTHLSRIWSPWKNGKQPPTFSRIAQQFHQESTKVLEMTMEIVDLLINAARPEYYKVSEHYFKDREDKEAISKKISFVFCVSEDGLLSTVLLAAIQKVRLDIVIRFFQFLLSDNFIISEPYLQRNLIFFLRNFCLAFRERRIPLTKKGKALQQLTARLLVEREDYEFISLAFIVEAIPFIWQEYCEEFRIRASAGYKKAPWLRNFIEKCKKNDRLPSFNEARKIFDFESDNALHGAITGHSYMYSPGYAFSNISLPSDKGVQLAKILFLLISYQEATKKN